MPCRDGLSFLSTDEDDLDRKQRSCKTKNNSAIWTLLWRPLLNRTRIRFQSIAISLHISSSGKGIRALRTSGPRRPLLHSFCSSVYFSARCLYVARAALTRQGYPSQCQRPGVHIKSQFGPHILTVEHWRSCNGPGIRGLW